MRRSFWEEARKNRLISYAFLAFMFFLYALLSYVVYEISPVVGIFAFFLTLLYVALILLQPLSMTSHFIGAMEIKNPKDLKLKKLVNVVEEIRIAAGYPIKPRIYLINSDCPNAFAFSLGDRVAIGVTRGLIERLNREELSGVIAHEFSHIINRDSEVKLIGFLALVAISVTAEAFLRSRGGGRRKGGGLVLLGIALALISMFLSRVLFFALSRKRETLADVEAVRLTRNKYALINALKKIASSPCVLNVPSSSSFLFFTNPLKEKDFFTRLFATHPPIEERIKLLEEL